MELARLAWSDARDALSERTIALLPVGSIENHGPHLPLGTDLMTAEHIARRAAEDADFLLCPSIPVGVSYGHRQFAGTLWVELRSLVDYVYQVARSLSLHGPRRLVFVNGHGGNAEALREVCGMLRRDGVHAFVFQWWVAIAEVVREVCEMAPDHAGDMETSVMLSFAADLVRTERARDAEMKGAAGWGRRVHGVQVGFDTVDFTSSGATGKPTAATREKGERLVTEASQRLVAFGRWLEAQEEEELAEKPAV